MTSPYQGDGDYSRTATVNLDANLGTYPQQVQAATRDTNALADALDKVESKLSSISQRAGTKLVHIAAADVALLTSAATGYAVYEKQLSTLNATAAITPLNMRGVRSGIENAFTSLPASRTQIVGLATDLTNLGVTGSRDIGQLVTTMLKLSAASGEPVQGLAQGLVQLSRLMGTTNAQQIGNYANAVLTVSKNAGVSVTGVLSFAQAIAPMARQAGIGEAAVLGISAAFSKAGADGYVAANTFNSIVGDITKLTQSGSPELAKYANLIGVTVQQFKGMDKTTVLTDIFETIAKQGPAAVNTLNRLGIDGVRAQSAITAVVQSGDLQKSISTAQGSSGNQNNLNKASSAATGGLADNLEVLRNQMTQLVTVLGEHLVPFLNAGVHGLSDMAKAVTMLVKPFAPLIDILGTAVGLLSALGGGALLAGGLLAKIVVAGAIGRSSPVGAFLGGRRNAMTGQMNPYAENAAAGTQRWYQRPFYGAGQRVGRDAAFRSAENAERAALGLGPRFSAGSVLAAPIRGASWLVGQQRQFVDDAGRPGYARSAGFLNAVGRGATRVRGVFTGGDGEGGSRRERAAAAQQAAAEKLATEATERMAAAETRAATIINATTREREMADGAVAAASKELAVALARLEIATVRSAAATSGSFIGFAGKKVASGVGSVAGSLGPLGIGLIAATLAPSLIHAINGPGKKASQLDDSDFNAILKYNQALGTSSTNLAAFSTAVAGATGKLGGIATPKSLGEAATVTPGDVGVATSGYKVVDDNFSRLAKTKDTGAAVSYLQTLTTQQGGMDPKTLGSVKSDLIATFGKDKASQILSQYLRTSGGRSGGNIDYASLGGAASGLGNDDFKKLTQQGLGGITSQAALAPGQQSSRAALGSLISLYGSALQGTTTGESDSQKTVRAELAKFLGGNAKDFHSLPGSDTTTGDFTSAYASKQSSQLTVLRSILGSKQGQQYLSNAGVTLPQMGPQGYSAQQMQGLLGQLTGSRFPAPQASQQANLISRSGSLGAFSQRSDVVQSAVAAPSNPGAQYQAMLELFRNAGGGTDSTDKVSAAFDHLTSTIGDTSDQLYILGRSAKAYAQQEEQFAQPYQSRTQQLSQRSKDYVQAFKANQREPGPETASDLNTARQNYEAQKQSYQQYMLSVYQTAQAYGVQMERAQQDQDTSIYRSNRDFYIQMEQSQQDYHKQTYRAQRDFNISLQQQAEQAAQNIYNPFLRVQAQYTTDAGTLVQNLQDQNQRIQQQLSQLAQLRKMGVSNQAIQELDLANPNNAQQTNNLVQSLAQNPALVAAINKAVGTRLSATTKLTQNEFSLAFNQTVENFKRGLSDTADDYGVQQKRAVDSQRRALGDMATDYNKMVNRSAQDLTTQMTELYGSYANVYTKTVKKINDTIGIYAPGIAKDLVKELAAAEAAINSTVLLSLTTTGATTAGSMSLIPGVTRNNDGTIDFDHNPRTGGGHAEGGISIKEHTARFSEHNKAEMLVPLDQRGMQYMTQFTENVTMAVLRRMLGSTRPGLPTGQSAIPQYQMIDQSMTFSGPISVAADDPKAMKRELDKQKQLDRLSRPTAGSSGR